MPNFEPESLSHTNGGSVYTTDEFGQLNYAAQTSKDSEMVGGDRSRMPQPPASQLPMRGSDRDVHGHVNPMYRNAGSTYFFLETQSSKSNGGVGYGADSPNPQPHQQLVESRFRTYMRANPDDSVNWEIWVKRGAPSVGPDGSVVPGSPVARYIRVSVDDGNGRFTPVDLVKPTPYSVTRTELQHDADGWIRISEK